MGDDGAAPVRRTVPHPALGRIAAGGLVALAGLAVVVRRTGDLPGDGVLTRPSLDGGAREVAEAVDRLTGYGGTAVLTALVVLVLVRLGRGRAAVLSALSVSGAVVGTALVKRLVARPRPELVTADVSQFSFPSGHVAATSALVVAVVLAARGTRALRPGAVVGTLLLLVAAAAQLGLGLHHPSDVVGGWLWAVACTTAVWAVLDRPAER